jgi:hypothetical protein
MYKEKRNILLTGLLFLQIALVKLASGHSDFVETYYSRGIYPYISRSLRLGMGWLKVSIGDLIYLFLIVLLVRLFYRMIQRKEGWRSLIFRLGASVSVFYFLFYFLWGLNYSRKPVSEDLGLVTGKFDIEKVEQLTARILKRTAFLQSQLSAGDSLPVVIPHSKEEILRLTPSGYAKLSEHFDQYAYSNPSIKKSLFSLPLTYMGFAGYLNPITGEAQVDGLIPKVSLPLTCSHEVAHQLGIAYENEANFVGFLAASVHEDPFFNYAAMLFALRYSLIDIRRYDKELFEAYAEKIPEGVRANLREIDEFWQSYENPFEPVFKSFYDHYLKYNQQKDGLETYNQIVELLISFDQTYDLDIY